MKIYNSDGTFKELTEGEFEVITINSSDLSKMENYETGVNVYYKDGSVRFINNAETDGYELTVRNESE